MGLIDFILNIAALLLWLNWRAITLDPLATATPATLVGTLRRAEPSRVRRWHFLVALAALLALRAALYRYVIGPALNSSGQLDLIATHLSFTSNQFQPMLLFSCLSFALTLLEFYLSLLLVSLLSPNNNEFPFPRLARQHLGPVDRLPIALQILVPFLVGFIAWWIATWPFSSWGVIPRPISELHRLAQAALVGCGAYLTWKYLLAALLAMHLLNNHIYFGPNPIWNYITATARRVLRPLKILPLQFGKIDFAPLVGIAVILLAAQIAERGLSLFGYRIMGLADLYRNLVH